MNQSAVILLVFLIFVIAIISTGCLKKDQTKLIYSHNGTMLTPTSTGNSVELCLNSRVSYHDGYRGQASDQWLSNVLWASGQAPIVGDYRNIYVTTPQGKYLYNSDTHKLSNKSSGNSGKAAFVLNYDRELDFDAGTSYMFALLESVSLWNGTRSQLASCPKQESLYFGIRDVAELTDELAVKSSDGSLPDPRTNGNNSLEDVIANLKYTSNFSRKDILLEDLSQILWAGYGCTPHTTYNDRAGLTVPSWMAEYFLTENIYVVKLDGVFKYHNRNPGSDLTTRDHRLELVREGDVREDLRLAIKDLPDAPCYIVLCLDAEDVDKWYARLETGFAAGNMLLQGSALGVGCWFTTELTSTEQEDIQKITGMGKIDVPHVIVSIGYV